MEDSSVDRTAASAREILSAYIRPAADRAFAKWCAKEKLAEDAVAPHGEAFYSGYEAGYDEAFDVYG